MVKVLMNTCSISRIIHHEAKSVVWVDIDNDGDQDLFITYRLEPNRMYLNHGGLIMEDISETCGILIADRRSYGASFGDYDNDGLLDLFVANYVSGSDEPFNELYHNLGNGQFEEVTFESSYGTGHCSKVFKATGSISIKTAS
jgi:hypothetical protein